MKASPARIFLGLLLGAVLGHLCTRSHNPLLRGLPAALAPVGTLFLNAIRVCVLPLVVGGLVSGCAVTGNATRLGRLAARSLVLILCYLAAAAVFAGVLAFPLFRHLHASLLSPAPSSSPLTTADSALSGGFAEWVTALIPANVFRAAADGALLPLITLSIAVGVTLSRMPRERQEPLLRWFQSVTEVFTRLIDVVLQTAPIGIFCLAVNLSAATGSEGLRSLLTYVVVLSLISGAFILLVLYPSVAIFAPISLPVFLRAAAPAQALAFTSRSSLAALPATYKAAQEGLGIPSSVSTFFFPFAASIFRVGGCIAQVVGVCFLAGFYNVSLSLNQLTILILSAVAVSLTVPGVPGGAILVMTPILASLNIPVAGVAMLLAVDTLPDMFRTTANVAGWLAAGTVLSRSPGNDLGETFQADRESRS